MPAVFFYSTKPESTPIDGGVGLDCWIHKTWMIIKDKIADVPLFFTNSIPSEGIIIFHKGFFPQGIKPNKNQLFVCIQADYGRHKYAQCHIHQNPSGVRNYELSKQSFFEEYIFPFTKNYFIPHWNQENIIARRKDRVNKFENISYFGTVQNFPKQLLNPYFCLALKEMGLSFKMVTTKSDWNDYSISDCVLSIRDFEGKPHLNKPFSKIINSYLAGVPVIAGNESSTRYLKDKFNLDIPVALSMNHCLQLVSEMKSSYQYVRESIPGINYKLRPYHDKNIVNKWHEVFVDLEKIFRIWNKSNFSIRKIFYGIRH